jgi:hypothetical protein
MPVSAMRLAVGNDVLSSRLWQAGLKCLKCLKLWIEEIRSQNPEVLMAQIIEKPIGGEAGCISESRFIF